jgi:hypothetical protein
MSLPVLNDHLDIKSHFATALSDYLNSASSVRVKVGAVRQIINGLATCCNHYGIDGSINFIEASLICTNRIQRCT